MKLSAELIAEMEVLALFDLNNTQAGIKIHHEAEASRIEAAQRLHAKGLISQPDGGYLQRQPAEGESGEGCQEQMIRRAAKRLKDSRKQAKVRQAPGWDSP